jgi:hypothetical protein
VRLETILNGHAALESITYPLGTASACGGLGPQVISSVIIESGDLVFLRLSKNRFQDSFDYHTSEKAPSYSIIAHLIYYHMLGAALGLYGYAASSNESGNSSS